VEFFRTIPSLPDGPARDRGAGPGWPICPIASSRQPGWMALRLDTNDVDWV
jgi:hypothetical protein